MFANNTEYNVANIGENAEELCKCTDVPVTIFCDIIVRLLVFSLSLSLSLSHNSLFLLSSVRMNKTPSVWKLPNHETKLFPFSHFTQYREKNNQIWIDIIYHITNM